jgi:xylulokinase
MYYIGFDIGSSSVKVAIVEMKTGKSIGVVQEPETEMGMLAVKNGWAEQNPHEWWQYAARLLPK